ncbi:tRNA (adenosine(37)-N6)-threonylcarbamoyltransferase complex dimerization subunit type 1 TsaB [Patescibacteria group bacterium]|nr:tRNA (adenosine(37)-N6)-threonylcarbamoyltransferase complex dimerization subunit type 1 TsaB [Patescibacteria group bacterium]
MNCLFIDIASHDGFIALASEREVIVSREVTTRIRDHELVPLVEELLDEAGWKYEDLTNIACVIGPGGFTSLRVAVSFANTLIDQLGIEGVGVHLSEILGCRVRDRVRDTYWVHATKRDSLFVKGGEWTEPTLVTLEEFSEKVPRGAEWMGELLDEQIKALDSKQLKKAEIEPITQILPQLISQQRFESKPLEPWYGRTG